ncbi:MAG: CPBP family intramembrane metalloprotease [Chloroflexi bacterium]|nr:CPBP family intramembrane metalloprotease [Chloroflexota bacterium]
MPDQTARPQAARGAAATRPARGNRALVFLLLAYGISWAALVPEAAASLGHLPRHVPGWALYVLGGWGPALAALLLTARDGGRAAVADLAGRLLAWRVGARWYAVALVGAVGPLATAFGAHLAAGGTLPALAGPGAAGPLATGPLATGPLAAWGGALLVAGFTAVSLVGEELGWRGYALPALQARYSAAGASLILGIMWGAWHLPMALAPATGSAAVHIPLAWYLLDIIGATFFYTWVVNSTGGSLLLATLIHTAGNVVSYYLPVATLAEGSGAGYLALIAVRWAVAGLLVWRAGGATLSRCPAEGNPYYARAAREVSFD